MSVFVLYFACCGCDDLMQNSLDGFWLSDGPCEEILALTSRWTSGIVEPR